MSDTDERDDRINAAYEALDALSDEERSEVFTCYCFVCGGDPSCYHMTGE